MEMQPHMYRSVCDILDVFTGLKEAHQVNDYIISAYFSHHVILTTLLTLYRQLSLSLSVTTRSNPPTSS